MKLTCEREKLLNAFQLAAGVAPTRSPKPILENVKLEVTPETVTLMATDLEIGIRSEVPGIEVETPGSAILPISRFGSILRESSDESLNLEADGQVTVVRGERSEFRLPGEDPAQFPPIADFSDEKYHEVPSKLLREIIRRTAYATDNESTRYALGGVLLELGEDTITAVGTDGRRLAKMEGPATSVGGHATGDSTVIVPTRAMQMIERAFSDADAEIQIATHANEVLVRNPRTMIYARLLEGRFPRWRDVFPRRDNAIKIEMNVATFFQTVRQAAIVTSEESRGIDFTFGGGLAVLAGRAAETGEARIELPISYDGQEVTVTLDPRFMIDFLKVLDPGSSFSLELQDAESAVVCSTEDGYGYVIMPLARDR